MVGFYNYTVYMTYIGMLSAVAGILFAAENETFSAVLCLIICGIVDALDGTIARTKKNRTASEKRFGIEIDSLSDLVAFGVLPAAIVFSLSSLFDSFVMLARVAALFYALCALIRLAYFDVIAHEKLISGKTNKSYVGLPVTSCAWVIPAAVCLLPYVSDEAALLLMPILLFVMGLLFITPFRLKKPGKLFLFIGILLSVALLVFLFSERASGLI